MLLMFKLMSLVFTVIVKSNLTNPFHGLESLRLGTPICQASFLRTNQQQTWWGRGFPVGHLGGGAGDGTKGLSRRTSRWLQCPFKREHALNYDLSGILELCILSTLTAGPRAEWGMFKEILS